MTYLLFHSLTIKSNSPYLQIITYTTFKYIQYQIPNKLIKNKLTNYKTIFNYNSINI